MKILFTLLIVFVFSLDASAQATISQGSIATFYSNNVENPPRELYLGFSIRGGISAFLSNDNQVTSPTVIVSNRQIVRLTYTIQLSQTARGDVSFATYGCVNTYLANPNQPLSTRFETVFGDFRAPKFTKSGSALNSLIEVTTSFRMTGRASCLEAEGTVRGTEEIIGSGTATLRFKRTRSNPKQALLVGASYAFSPPSAKAK